MHKKKRTLPRVQYSSASESYKDTDPLGSVNLKPSIANSHVQDLIAHKWDKEKAKSFQPYNDHKFNRVAVLPPNELAFMGGTGKNKGNPRSILHIQRPTEVQKIYKMRTANRGMYGLTEDPRNTTSTVPQRHPVTRKNEAEKVKSIVDRVWMANNFEDKAKSSDSDSVYMTKHVKRAPVETAQLPQTFQAVEQIRARLEEIFKIPDELMEHRETFTEWAIRERERYKQKRAQLAGKQEKNVTETLSIHDESESWDTLTVSEKIRRTRKKDVIQHVSGYMYGQFTKPPKQNRNSTKFGIPLSMIERAKEEAAKQEEKDRKLRRARIAHMKLPIFFDEENSEEDDVMETVKALTLVRTPFLRLPKIKTQQKRRRDRLKSKYLKHDRLNRITMLLYDRSNDPTVIPASVEERDDEASVDEEKKAQRDFSELSAPHKKFIKFIKDTYAEQMKHFTKDQVDALTFEQFKETEKLNVSRTKSSTPMGAESAKADDENLLVPVTKKNMKFDRSDAIWGPFYYDPDQIEKAKNPTLCNLT